MKIDTLFIDHESFYLMYVIHIVVSFILAVILSKYTLERFQQEGEKIDQRDKERLESVSYRGSIFQKLFSISLHKNNRKSNIFFIFLFNLAMPLIGYIFSVWVTWYLKNVKYSKRVSNTSILNLDEFGISFLKVERIFGEGSMSELMNSEYAPRSKKLKALSALANSLSPANLRIIRSTLSSTDDEIRMFGYATINKAEKNLSIKINKYLEIYHEERDKGSDRDLEREASAAKELAGLYWEMVYTELSHESLKDGFLKEIKKYMKIAKDFYIPRSHELHNELKALEDEKKEQLQKEPKETYESQEKKYDLAIKLLTDRVLKCNDVTTKLYVLMGKVYMNERDYERAVTEFTIAQELYEGASSFILPYLAEIQFLTGNYSVVKSIMSSSEELSLNATLYPIIEQWKCS